MRLRGARWFHALWIAAVLLALAIWLDLVWAGCVAILVIGFVLAAFEWLVSLASPKSRPRRRLFRR
jgi:hypothetical protein